MYIIPKDLTSASIRWIIHQVDTFEPFNRLADRAKRFLSKLRKCAVCGHEWIRRDGGAAELAATSRYPPDPARCPNHKCRSTKWRAKQEGAKENERIDD
jgi:hypothetical protein